MPKIYVRYILVYLCTRGEIIKNKKIIIAVLAVAIAMLFLGSVSAAEDTLYANLTADDNSLEISEVNEINADDIDSKGDINSVGVENENDDVLKVSDDEILKSSEKAELCDKATCSTDVTVAAGTEVTIHANMAYDYWYLKMSTDDGATYSTVKDDTGHAYWYDLYTFTAESGTYKFYITNYYGRYDDSEVLTYTVGAATADTTTTLDIQKDSTDNTKVTITPTVQNATGSIATADSVEIYINGEKYGSNVAADGNVVYTNSEENTYSVYARFIGDENNSESNSTVYLFTLGTTKSPVNLTVSLSDNATTLGDNITITPNLKDENGNAIDGKISIYEVGTDEPIASALSNGEEYIYTPDSAAHIAGSTYQLYAVFSGDETYAATNSSKVSYKIKQTFDIVLTVEGGDNYNVSSSSSYSGTSVNFAVDCGSYTPTVMDIYVGKDLDNMDKFEFEGTSDTISFTSSDRGLNYVYVKFAGDDDYAESTSNTVTVGVYYPYTVSVSLNPKYGLELTTVTVTPSVTYNSNNISGILNLYSDYSKTDLIASVETGNGVTFDYSVPEYTGSEAYTSKSIYYAFEGYDNENYILYTGSGSTSFTIMNENSLNITAKNSTDGDAQSAAVQIEEGGSVIFTVANLDYKYSYATTNVYLYVEGESGSIAQFPTSGYYGTTLGDLTVTFNSTKYPAGDYVLYAVYEGYVSPSYGYYYAPAESNKITVHVLETVVPEISIELDKTSVSKEGTITVTPTVTGASEGKGIVYFYDENNDTLGQIDLNTNTTFDYTVTGEAGSTHSIWAKYVDSVSTYPEVNSTKKDYKIKGILTITLARDGDGVVIAGDTVGFTITYSDVVSENLELWVNDTKLGDEDGSASTSITFDESDVGANNVFIKFLGNDDYDACVSNNVTVEVIKSLSTTVTLELTPDAVLSGQNITVVPTVKDENGNDVTVGVVKIYTSQYYYNYDPVLTINAGETGNYSDSSHYAGQTVYLYAVYFPADGTYKQSEVSTGVAYTILASNTLELTADGATEISVYDGVSFDVLATLTGGDGVITLYVNGVENTTLTEDVASALTFPVGDYTLTASYTRGTDYYASAESNEVTVHVLDIVQPEISIELSNSTVSKDGTITVTPTVIGASEGKGIVYFYDENNDTLGQIDLNTNTTFDYTVTGEAGSTHSIWAKYVDSVSTYPEANSTKKDYKIKGILTITLARDGDGVVIAGDTVDFTITFSDSVTDNLELWVNDTKLGDEDGSASTSITFDESDVGANNVFIKFLGNDDYDACVSNNVTVEVIKSLSTTVTLELTPDAVLSGQNITVVPTVKDENGNDVTVGVVKIYDTSSYYYSDPVLTINAGETGNYSDSIHYAGQTAYLYAVYFPADGTYKQSEVSTGVAYTILASNTLELTVNGVSEITVEEDASFDVLATLTGGDGVITLYVNGVENTTLTKDVASALTFPVGDYTLTASYTRGTDYYASAESNEVTVHVVEKSSQNQIVVSVEDVTLPSQVEIKVTATVDGTYTVDVNGTDVEVTVTGGEGSESITLPAGDYYANVTGQDDANITNAVFTVSPEPKIGELIIRDYNYPENATIVLSGEGNVTISIEYYLETSVVSPLDERITFNVGGNTKIVDNPVNGTYTGAFSFTINQTADFTVNASYYAYVFGVGEYEFNSTNTLSYSVTITEPSKKDVTLIVEVDEEHDDEDYYPGEWGDSFEIVTTTAEGIEGEIIYKEGEKELGRAAIGEEFDIDAEDLGLGEHNITAVFEGNDTYNAANYNFTINVAVKTIWFTLTVDNVTYPDHPVGKLYAEDVDGNYTITINGTEYVVDFEWYEAEAPVSFDINQLPVGTYKVSNITYEDMEHYEFGISMIAGQNQLPTFEVKTGEAVLNDTVLTVSNGTTPTFTINLTDATGNLTVTVNGKNYTAALEDGKATVEITDLDAGNYTATVTYSGDGNYKASSTESAFTVEAKTTPDANSTLDVNIPEGSSDPVFSINLENATGNLTVTIGNKTYTKELVNGSASITVSGLSPGSYNAIVTYSGDDKYAGISKNTTVTVPAPVLKASNIKVIYSASATYKVLVTVNGKAVAGVKVSITFNGKTYSASTDKNGYASLKLNTKVKVKSYAITATYKGVTVNNTLKVKHVIKAKNKKVKKSKKVNKVVIKLKKVNGKYIKNKKIKIKFKGKTYKVKTNKKGKAVWKVKKSVLKKLKVGKKYKYKVTYGKDKVTKKLKIKR